GRSPPLETLIDGVKFSRTFTPTYNIVLLSLLAIFVAMHFSRQVRVFKWPIKRKKTDPKVQAAGPITQRIEMIEQEPLLNYTHASYSTSSQISRRLQAILSYQPLPFNFQKWLSTHHIPIPAPDIQTCIAVFLFYTLNVFYAIYQVPISKTSSIFIFADRLGLLFVVNLPLLYLLAAKNCPLRALTGWSYEQLNVFHRAVGRAMIIMAIGHMGGFVAVWWQLLSKRLSFADFLKLPIISIGMAAGIAFLLLALGAKREIRRLGGYELFLIGHVGLQIIALVALLHHHRNCGNYVLTAFAIWWVDRIVWRFWV
ncbi:ferric reductase like transmembrane component-domain-containing protein, partial [Peziza echinospora]